MVRIVKPFYFLPFDGRDRRTRVWSGEICFAEAVGNYTVIDTETGEKQVCSLNLTQLSSLLKPPFFVRISRSHLVNLSKVVGFDAYDVCMDNGKVFAFGPKYRQGFISMVREYGMLY